MRLSKRAIIEQLNYFVNEIELVKPVYWEIKQGTLREAQDILEELMIIEEEG